MHLCAVLVLALFIPAMPVEAAPMAKGAQGPTGSIRGTVLNTVGTALSAITIEATGASGVVYRALTDRNGAFVLDAVAPDLYTVTAQGAAVKRAAIEQVRVSAGRSVTVDFTLARNSASDESRVTYVPGLVAGALDDGIVLPADLIDRLPKGRHALSLVPMAPGMSVDTVYSGLAFRGSSAPENRYFIDGLDLTNMFSGGTSFTLATDVVQELQVGGGAARFGVPAATGAVVNILTPSGGRQWRGSAAVYFTSDTLTGQSAPGTSRDPFTMWQPTVTAGGPLLGDWLSLFASYTPELTSTTRSTSTVTPEGAISSVQFKSAERTHLSADNVTGRVGTFGRFRVSTIFGRSRRTGTLPPMTTSVVAAGFNWATLTRSQPVSALSATVNLAPSSRFTMSAHAGYSRTDMLDYGVPEIVYRTGNAPGPSTPPDVAAALTGIRAASAGIPTNAAIDRDVQKQTTGGVSFALPFRALGEHQVRMGGDAQRLANDVLAGSFGPVVLVNAVNAAPPYGSFQVSSWLLSGRASTIRYAAFAEDTWRPGARLTIRAGVRSERQTVPPYAPTLSDPAASNRTVATPTVTFGFRDTISPTIGGTLDLRGDGRWVASGSWSVVRDPVKLDLARYYLGADIRYAAAYSLESLDFSKIGLVGCLSPAQCRFLYPGTLLSAIPTFPVRTSATPLQPTTGQDVLLGVDHAVAGNGTLGVRYIRKRLVRAFEDIATLTAAGAISSPLTLVTLGDAPVPLLAGGLDLPVPRRNYDAVEASCSGRFARGWQVHASYTFSRLTGNYTAFFPPVPNLSSSSYAPLVEPSWTYTAAYNTPLTLFDRNGSPVHGPLELDRPHVVKAQVYADLPFEVSAGVYQVVASGMPVSRMVSIAGQPVYYNGRMTDGRTPIYSQTDLRVQRPVRFGPRFTAQLAVNVLNVFNQRGTIAVDALQASITPLQPSQFLAGFDADALVAAGRQNALFLQPSVWQRPRQARIEVRLIF